MAKQGAGQETPVQDPFAAWSDEQRATLAAMWETAKWGTAKRTLSSLRQLREQYETFLEDVVEERLPADDERFDFTAAVRRHHASTADAILKVRFAIASIRRLEAALTGEEVRSPTTVREAIADTVVAFLPIITEPNRVLWSLKHQRSSSRGGHQRWAASAADRERWKQRVNDALDAHPAVENDSEIARLVIRAAKNEGIGGVPPIPTLRRYVAAARKQSTK